MNACLTTPNWSDVLQTEPRKKLTHKQNWPCIPWLTLTIYGRRGKPFQLETSVRSRSSLQCFSRQCQSFKPIWSSIIQETLHPNKLLLANIYISENEKRGVGRLGRRLYLLLLAFKPNFCFSVFAEIVVSFPNDSSLVYFINYGWEGGMCRQWAYYDLAQAVWQMHAVEPLCVVCLDWDCRKCFGSRFERMSHSIPKGLILKQRTMTSQRTQQKE